MAKPSVVNRSVRKPNIKTLVIVLLLLGLVVFGGWYFKTSQDLVKQNRELSEKVNSLNKELELYKTNPEQAAQAEVNRYVEEIGKLYALPGDEKPSVATVRDKEQLKDQQFFARAENGDITLIYTNAKLAILYRPSTNKIVNVSTVTIQDQPDTPQQP